MEAALAGTPTLFLDREKVLRSPLYSLGEGIIFDNIDDLWRACTDHWHSSGGILGFGDWSGLLTEIDPFRDGRAAERMGTYLHWVVEGFQGGLPREMVLADAADRYRAAWGNDKVLLVNTPQAVEKVDARVA